MTTLEFDANTVLIIDDVAVDGSSRTLKNIYLKKTGDNGEIALAAGKKYQIIPSFAKIGNGRPKKVTSSNTKVGTIGYGGVLKAKSPGTTTIAVETTTGIIATIKVEVVSADREKVSITNGSKATMRVGDGLRLKAKVWPAGTASKLTWKSSDTKVATVSSSGVVKAKKKGTATITATTANGKQAKIKITVKAKRTDLLYYIGKDIYAVAKQFGIKKVEPLAYDEGSLTGRGSKIQLYTYRNSPKIDNITCQQKGFTACGVECGMKYETAYEKAMQYFAKHGYAITHEAEADDPYDLHMEINGENPGAGVPRIGLAFWQENGMVSSVSISVWGD